MSECGGAHWAGKACGWVWWEKINCLHQGTLRNLCKVMLSTEDFDKEWPALEVKFDERFLDPGKGLLPFGGTPRY